MIRSDPWSRYQVLRDRRPVRRRMLLVIPLVVLLLYVAVHFVGVDWTQAQAIPLVDLAGQRWEVLWVPDTVVTGFQHHHLGTGEVTNLLQVRWR
jgi:hypothetical protein